MTAQLAISNTPATAFKARTAWMAGRDTPEPLRTAGTVVHVAEGREIFAEGEESDQFYKVMSGVVRVCKFLSDGRRQIGRLAAQAGYAIDLPENVPGRVVFRLRPA